MLMTSIFIYLSKTSPLSSSRNFSTSNQLHTHLYFLFTDFGVFQTNLSTQNSLIPSAHTCSAQYLSSKLSITREPLFRMKTLEHILDAQLLYIYINPPNRPSDLDHSRIGPFRPPPFQFKLVLLACLVWPLQQPANCSLSVSIPAFNS